MDQLIRTNLLNRFVDNWNGWTYKEKPTCFWVREYHLGDVNSRDYMPQFTWARNVWLIDEDGLHERNPLDWRRFEILTDHKGVFPPSLIFSGRIHEIGMGYFAPLGNSKFIYQQIWGRRWGSCFILTIDDAGTVISESMAWIS